MALVTLASACQDDKYVANVTELSLVRMDPESGYSGAIVKVLGRNFSEKAKDNVVLIGGKEAKVLDANKWDLTIVVPENEPAEYEVEVTTPAGKAGGIKFLYKEKPEHVYLASIYAGQAGKNGVQDGMGVPQCSLLRKVSSLSAETTTTSSREEHLPSERWIPLDGSLL